MIDYEKVLTSSVQSIKPSGIRKYFDVVNELDDAISLGVGEPDFITPWAIGRQVYTRLRGAEHTIHQMQACLH